MSKIFNNESDKKKKKTLHLSINEIQSVGNKLGIRKTSIEKPSRNKSDNFKKNNSEINSNLLQSNYVASHILNRSTPKTTKTEEINLFSIKDYNSLTLSNNQISPVKGRNSKLMKNIKNTIPLSETSINKVKNNTNQITLTNIQSTSQSPLTTTNKSRSVFESNTNSSAFNPAQNLKCTTFLKSKSIHYKNCKKTEFNSLNFKNNSNADFKEKDSNKERRGYNNSLNKNKTLNSGKKTNETPNNAKIQNKLCLFKELISELLASRESAIKDVVINEIKTAYKRIINVDLSKTIDFGLQDDQEEVKQKLDELDFSLNKIKTENNDKEFIKIRIFEFDNIQTILKSLKLIIERSKGKKYDNISKSNNTASPLTSKLNLNQNKKPGLKVNNLNAASIINTINKFTNAQTPSSSNEISLPNKELNISKNRMIMNRDCSQEHQNLNQTEKVANSNLIEKFTENNYSESKKDDKHKFTLSCFQEQTNEKKEPEEKLNFSINQSNSDISIDQHDLYYNNQIEDNKFVFRPELKMAKLELKVAASSKDNNIENTINLLSMKSTMMKDNFLKEKDNKDSSTTLKQDNSSTNRGSKVYNTGNTLAINLSSLPKQDFNDEFMEYSEDFSPSWRQGCQKINLHKKFQ